jgi:hypothetical protein
LNTSGNIQKLSSLVTSSGIANFTLKILYEGLSQIIVSSLGMNNATTNSFNIINYPEALIITPYPGQSLTISRYFPFQFTTCLYYGNNHQDYNYSYNLYPSLNDSSLIFINEQ